MAICVVPLYSCSVLYPRGVAAHTRMFSKLANFPNFPKFGNAQAVTWRCSRSFPNYELTVLSLVTANENKDDRSAQAVQLCRMRLPYCQRQQERVSRRCRDPKLAMRTAVTALLLVAVSVVSAAATIRPPEVRIATTRDRLCWDDYADKSEREGTFQRKPENVFKLSRGV